MFKSKSIKICERFSAHRWAKSRHVLLITLIIGSLFVFSPKASFAKNYNGLNAENKNKSVIKKISVLFLAFSICFLCFSIIGSSLASAATVYVDTDGSGNYNCDGTNDHVEINKALTDTYNKGGGTVYLRGPNTYWIDATLEIGSNTILTGDSSACIKLVPNAGWSVDVPLIRNKSGAQKGITIKGFEIDGNSEKQSVSRGKGYYNLMYFENCKDITVTDMRLEWGTGDGLKVKNKPYSYSSSANIKFTGNSVYKLGHDALYVLGMNGVTVANNDVFTRTNSAFRLSSSGNAKIYNNVVHSEIGTGGTSTGPGIEIDKSSGYKSENIEIYKNTFHTLNGAAIWIDGEDRDNVIRGKNVYIHDNTMRNVGQYGSNTGYSNAAITIGQFDNTRIENNVIDNGGHAGIKYYQYTNSYKMSAKFTTYVTNNVIRNCNKNVATGVWNYNSANHKFVLKNNRIYDNAKGSYTGTNIEHSGDSSDSSSTSSSSSDSSSAVSNKADNPPVANAGADKTAAVNAKVLFDGSASTDDNGIKSYSWDFDSSNGIKSEATGKTATKTYTKAGTYTVTLTVTDTSGQKSTDTVKVVVGTSTTTTSTTTSGSTTTSSGNNLPVANAGADKTAAVNSKVSFDGGSSTASNKIVSYRWDFDASNGITTEATGQRATKTYTKAGTYTVTLTVTDSKGQKSTDTLTVVVGGKTSAATTTSTSTTTTTTSGSATTSSGDKPPVANAGADQTATRGKAVSFSGSSSTDDNKIVSYRWDFDASNGITTEATGMRATKTYTKAGTYTVTLTVIDSKGQKSTDTLRVVVK